VVCALSLYACRPDKPAEDPPAPIGPKANRVPDETKPAEKEPIDMTQKNDNDDKRNDEKKPKKD
jgi:hypothetical protein